MKKYEVHRLVEKALIEDEMARNDDFVLILDVLSNYTSPSMSLDAVMRQHVFLGIPSLESITRARRKIQSEREDLISERMKERRAKEQEEFREYAKETI